MCKYILVLSIAFSIFMPTMAGCEALIPFGNEKGQVAFINDKNHPGIEEPLPLGPLAFQKSGEIIYVADSVGGKVSLFHQKKGFVKEFIITATPSEMLFDDIALDITNDKVVSMWLIDALSNSLLNINEDGKLINRITCDDFIQPYRVKISPSKLLYVADKGARKIFILNTKGAMLHELSWEWSGLAISPDVDILYRLLYLQESNTTFLVSSNLEGKITLEKELKLGEHFNTELWAIDETNQEMLITYATSKAYVKKLVAARVGFDGEVKGKKGLIPPFAMNRFIAFDKNEFWIASGDYSKAPNGSLKIHKFALP